jgi:NAD(P)-dependent dehydrogenase (short-subunit alcohol dehydrogenase family)
MTDRLDNQTVVVMGGSSGIGAATARRFAQAGARVLVNGRDPDKCAVAAEQIGGEAAVADASDRAQLDALFARAGTVDHLVIGVSGAAGGGPLAELDPDVLHAAFTAKFWAHLHTLQAALPHLAPNASITLITAGSARAALPGTAGLAAINGALQAMVGPLAAELAPRRVNAVSPGVVDTPWWAGVPEREQIFATFAKALPVRRIGDSEDVAAAIHMVATNGFMTGTITDVDGGGHLSAAGQAIL